jgi:hypothetical protein
MGDIRPPASAGLVQIVKRWSIALTFLDRDR